MRNEKRVKNLIIGGGLSGLAMAYYLGDDYLILEKEKEPGGYCRTLPNKDYVWDYAGHFYHFQTEKYKNLFLSLVDESEIIRQKKNTKIYYKDKLIDYPFQTNIHELEKEEFIECLYDLYFRDDTFGYTDFLGMLYAKFGKAITEKFLKPYNEKLYATDLKSLDKDAMGRFFPYADFEQVIRSMGNEVKKTYNDEFMYLKKGTGYFIDKLYEQLDKQKVLLETSVSKVDLEKKYVETESGEVIYYGNLINSAPLNQFLGLIDNDSYNKLAKELSYNKVLVFNLGFDKASLKYKNEHWVYYPDKNLNFYRIGFYNNILRQEKLSVYVEIGFPKDGKINVELELKKTIEGMNKVGIIDDSVSLADKSVLIMDPAYVHIETKEMQEVNSVMDELKKKDVHMLGRYGRWTYNCMEDCIALADELAGKLKNEK